MYLHIILHFDALRSGLHRILEEAKYVLRHDLIFELHRTPRFKAENVIDNPSNLGLNFYFLDNPRNNFQVADRWLITKVQTDSLLVDRFL